MRRKLTIPLAAAAGFAVAVMAGIAVAKSFTLSVEKSALVDNGAFASFRVKAVDTHETVAIGAKGYAVYTFQGETTHHIICKKTSSASTDCWSFWPPVTVSSAKNLSKETGIKGKLGAFRNHGKLQLTLNGQPVYYFTPDLGSGNKHEAMGDELKTFGSIWHVVTASASAASSGGSQTGSTMTTSTTTGYPPGYY